MAGDEVTVIRYTLPAEHPVARDVPTLIFDSAAWVEAEHYDNAKAEIRRLSTTAADGAVRERDVYKAALEEITGWHPASVHVQIAQRALAVGSRTTTGGQS